MNVYDFDKTIYDGDSTADFYFFSLKRHKKIILLFPSLAGAFIKYYIFKKGTKTQFKETMYRFLRYCDTNTDVEDFWSKNIAKIKPFYKNQQKADDIIISASPRFLLEPACKKAHIKHLICSEVDPISGKYTGINCHGKEKVRRFYETFKINNTINKFYSDSHSDDPLAKIAVKAFMVDGKKIKEWRF